MELYIIIVSSYFFSLQPGLKIEKGSGHFTVDDITAGGSGTAAAAQFRYDARGRTVHVEPMAEGRLQVVVRDLCLDPSPPARATVFISDVHQIQLTVVDKVCSPDFDYVLQCMQAYQFKPTTSDISGCGEVCHRL